MKWNKIKDSKPGKAPVIIIKDCEIAIGDVDDCQHGCWTAHWDRGEDLCVDTLGYGGEGLSRWGGQGYKSKDGKDECTDKDCIDMQDIDGWVYLQDLLDEYYEQYPSSIKEQNEMEIL